MKWLIDPEYTPCEGYIEFILKDDHDEEYEYAWVKFDGCFEIGRLRDDGKRDGNIWCHYCDIDEEIKKLQLLKQAIEDAGFLVG